MTFKLIVKMLVVLSGLFTGLFTGLSAAAQEVLSANVVHHIAIRGAQDIVVYTPRHHNPSNCTEASAVMIGPGHLAYTEMLGTVLAAKTTRTKIAFSVEGCISKGSRSYPSVSSLTWE
ncbi:MAG: hypothetical protein ACI8PT_000810 [Gammaproteobacteria bacterium]|jgi:hypothetical protein